MKKIFKIAVLCMALMLAATVCTFAAELTVTTAADEILIDDAKTTAYKVSGTYSADAMVTLEITNKTSGVVVLSEQSECDEDGAYTIGATMSDDVAVGEYEVKIGAEGLETAKTYTLNIVEEDTSNPKVVVNVVNGSATVEVNGVDKGTAAITSSYPAGTSLSFTAVPADDSKVFLYWQDAVSKVILSKSETIDVIVGSDAEYKAVYADKETEVYVTFTSNNRVLVSGLKGSITAPSNPYITGYTFAGWFVDGVKSDASLDVSENTTYVAGFTPDTTKYDITISGANEESASYKYNDKVTVTAKGEDGKEFTHWTKDGVTVSYSNTYSFYVNGAATVVANYADSAVEEQIVIAMAAPVVVGDNLDKIAFYAERNVPAKYTVLETGILLSQSGEFDLDSEDAIKAKASSKANIGQYTVRKAGVKSGETWNAKSYLIYSDGTETYTVYSNMVTKTLD